MFSFFVCLSAVVFLNFSSNSDRPMLTLLACFFHQEEVYSRESSQQLLEKDVIQLHTTRYRSLRKVLLKEK